MFSTLAISFLTALGAAYFYLNASGEIIRILALLIVTICALIDLVIAPWPIQFVILIIILFWPRNLSLPSNRRIDL
ncbi:MAG TPA: hypothetical protein IGR89_13010 [Oscillatoriaceae cyanobacterium M7585_C2015_266]|nr:hypothetical protein [Oscillatoriaceae cyanobacterium M7585_C2015_266]